MFGSKGLFVLTFFLANVLLFLNGCGEQSPQLPSDMITPSPDSSPRAESGLITTIGTFVIAGLLLFFSYRLLISGSRPEKSGVEIAGFKVNLESTTGSFLLVASLVILLIALSSL